MSATTFWAKFAVADYVAVPVNTVGVMGAGLAKAIKDQMSEEAFLSYLTLCTAGKAKPGDSILGDSKYIFCFTKDHWKQKSRMEWVENCIKNLIPISNPEKTLLLPRLGAGLGGLSAEAVLGVINQYLPDMKWKEVYLT